MLNVNALSTDIKLLWQTIREKLLESCGTDEKKLALAEVMALRLLASDALSQQTMNALKSQKGPNKKFTR